MGGDCQGEGKEKKNSSNRHEVSLAPRLASRFAGTPIRDVDLNALPRVSPETFFPGQSARPLRFEVEFYGECLLGCEEISITILREKIIRLQVKTETKQR